MNIEAITAAENFAKTVLTLPTEVQDTYWAMLPDCGLSADEVRTLQEYVSLYHIFTNEAHYKKMQQAVAAMLYKTFNS